MKISIFGLGYVGTVSCGCLAKEGHEVIGVDISNTKVDIINAGKTPVIESEIGDIIKDAVEKGRLRATSNAEDAILNTDISFVSVGTPSQSNGNLELGYVEKVCEQIGMALKKKDSYHAVVLRSTMLPGSTRGIVIPALEKFSGKKTGREFGVCFNPEFLREGTSVHDFYNPPKTVIGASDEKCAAILQNIYRGFPNKLIITSIEVSEMVKYADNIFHAVKITFANEIGMICKKLGIDSHEVMDIFCEDTKLNLSPYYLKPGFAFGGSCLPKDIRAIVHKAKMIDVEPMLLSSLLRSNDKQIKTVIKRIIELGKKKIGFLGFSFKGGTDDLRESPIVEVVETLIGKGFCIKLYDRNVNIARLVGANKTYIERRIPHLAELMCNSIESVIKESDVIIIGNMSIEFNEAISKIGEDKIIYDLVRIDRNRKSGGNYIGLAW
ncbi:MAG: nucleotide sugar dehydrogenase [Candidatus Brocadia sp.]|nr:nucleotide sugar dehydrogenase [Candidatus Brocadia sp.]